MNLFLLILLVSLTQICVALPNRQFHDGIEKAAQLLRLSINEKVDPCENFYEFTCGNWAANTQMLSNRTSNYGQSELLSDKMVKRLKDLLEESVVSQSRAINMAKNMYQSCMNTAELDRQKTSLLVSKLKKFGYWPILHDEKWNSKNFDLTQILKEMAHSRGILDVLISFDVHIDTKSRHTLFLRLGTTLLPKDDYQNETKMEQYAASIAQMVESIAMDNEIDISRERISEEAQNIVKFERDYSNLMVLNVELSREYPTRIISLINTGKPHTLKDAIDLLPELDLWEYFALLLHGFDTAAFSSYFASDPIVGFDPKFLKQLSNLLKNTDKRTIANYVLLRYAMEWREIGEEFHISLLNNRNQQQGEHCLEDICPGVFSDESFGPFEYACDTIYATKFFDKHSNAAVKEMGSDLRDIFAQMIENSEWLDPQTKIEAKDKLKQMELLVGYPEFLLGDRPLEALDAHYSKLNLYANDSYATMKEKASQWWIFNKFRKLLQPVNRREFDISNCIVNAIHAPAKNSIMIPSVNFEAPFFDKSFPFAMNFGAIGSTLGHEITHGFDDEGSKYDGQGKLRNWWHTETRKHFNMRKQCFIDQYSSMRIPEINENLNGTISQGEIIADNGGLKESFMAYKVYLQETGHVEKQVPGFERFTNEQLFFMSFGMSWCEYTTEESLKAQYNKEHPPVRYRVNGAVKNSADFAKAFNCQLGSAMNPKNKCELW